MRLIDADECLKKIYSCRCKQFIPDADTLYACMDIIENAPTIEPVKHGHWKVVFVTNAKSIEKNYYCSQCGEKMHYAYKRNYNYCPDCGAKMKMEDKE